MVGQQSASLIVLRTVGQFSDGFSMRPDLTTFTSTGVFLGRSCKPSHVPVSPVKNACMRSSGSGASAGPGRAWLSAASLKPYRPLRPVASITGRSVKRFNLKASDCIDTRTYTDSLPSGLGPMKFSSSSAASLSFGPFLPTISASVGHGPCLAQVRALLSELNAHQGESNLLAAVASAPGFLVPAKSYCTIVEDSRARCGSGPVYTVSYRLVRITSGQFRGKEGWTCGPGQLYRLGPLCFETAPRTITLF